MNDRLTRKPNVSGDTLLAPYPSPTIPLTTTRVLLVHAAPVIRLGLATLIRSQRHFELCAETAAAPTGRELFRKYLPDLVVLGLSLQGGDGIELIKEFRKLAPAARTLVLTSRSDTLSMQRAFRAGARGYVVARDDMSEILQAMRQILKGERYASPSVAQRLLHALAAPSDRKFTPQVDVLSDRELQVFRLLGGGLRAGRVAAELHLSVKTIETHQMRIKQKLGLRSAVELNAEAEQWLCRVARLRPVR